MLEAQLPVLLIIAIVLLIILGYSYKLIEYTDILNLPSLIINNLKSLFLKYNNDSNISNTDSRSEENIEIESFSVKPMVLETPLVSKEDELELSTIFVPVVTVNLKPIPEIPEWWNPFLNEFYHLMIVGSTGAGKSTFTYAMITALSHIPKARILILDSHASPDWRLPAVGGEGNYEAIKMGMEVAFGEMEYRRKLWAGGRKKFDPVFIFIDEFLSIQDELPKETKKFMAKMSRQARKFNMRLILLTQSDRVESLGIKGEGDLRQGFTQILLKEKAHESWPEYFRLFHTKYACSIFHNNILDPTVNLDFIPYIANQPVNPKSAWIIKGLPPPKEIEEDILNHLKEFYDELKD